MLKEKRFIKTQTHHKNQNLMFFGVVIVLEEQIENPAIKSKGPD